MVQSPARSIDRDLLLQEACAELEQLLRAGQTQAAEAVLRTFPEPAADPEWALQLVYEELVQRERLGQRPAYDEYYRRFPQWQDELRKSFDIHETLLRRDTHVSAPGPGSTPGAELGPGPGQAGLRRYELLDEIGRGGMGVVYRARQPGLGRIVAVKMILAGEFADAADQARFRREAETAARLQHPNIVQVYEVGEQDGRPYLAMEYVDGGSLEELLRKQLPPARAAARLVETLARAVQYAHQRGVLHRDLKPANVLLQESGVRSQESRVNKAEGGLLFPDSCLLTPDSWIPKITDFGLAKVADEAAPTAGQTRTGAILGTPSYMAPEQAEGHRGAIGPPTDVYALGTILYELLTGRPPFRAATALETLEQVRTHEPAAPRHLQAGLPRDLETICLKCLMKEPGRRYESAQALADDLDRFLRGEPIRARQATVLDRAVKWMKRRPLAASLLATIVALIGSGLTATTLLWADADAARRAEAEGKKTAEARLAEKLIILARLEWTQDRIDDAQRHLDECPPQYRNRDWRYLHRMCHCELQRLDAKQAFHLVFAADGKRLAHCGLDGIKVWNVDDGRLLWHNSTDGYYSFGARFSQDGAVLHGIFETDRDRLSPTKLVLKAWDAGTGVPLREGTHFRANGYVRMPRDGNQFALEVGTGPSRELVIVDLATGHLRPIPDKAIGGLTSVLSSSGRYLGTKESHTPLKTVAIWDTVALKQIQSFKGVNVAGAPGIEFSHDESRLATMYYEMPSGTTHVRIYDVATGQPGAGFQCPGNHARDLAFSLDDRRLAVAGLDRVVIVWDLEARDPLMVLRGHKGQVYCLAFSPDGARLASSAGDGTVRIWDVRP